MLVRYYVANFAFHYFMTAFIKYEINVVYFFRITLYICLSVRFNYLGQTDFTRNMKSKQHIVHVYYFK